MVVGYVSILVALRKVLALITMNEEGDGSELLRGYYNLSHHYQFRHRTRHLHTFYLVT